MDASCNIIMLLVTNLDEDDFKAVADSLEMRDRLLMISDRSSIRGSKKRDFSYMVDSFKSPENLIARIKRWQRKNRLQLAGIIGLDEEHHYRFSSTIAQEFSLEYYDKQTINLCSNKYLQRERLKRDGILVPEFQLINSQETEIGFPNVLKIITGYASCYVYLNSSSKELRRNWAELKKMARRPEKDPILALHSTGDRIYNPRNEFVIEEYIHGNEYSCDYLVKDDIQILRVVRKYSSRFGFFDALYLFNPDQAQGEFSIKELRDVCMGTAKALGIKRGVCMMDFIVKDGVIYVIETTIRPGISTFVSLMSNIYKTTSIDLFMKDMLESLRSYKIPDENGLVIYISAPGLGKIINFDTRYFEENWHDLSIIEICKYLNTGRTIRTSRERLQLGYIMLKDIAEKDIPNMIKLVRDKTIIEVEKCRSNGKSTKTP